jgi:DNA-binding PadR family transcriptional regulator
MSDMAGKQQGVSEHEGMLLALVIRQQPVTPYQLFRIFERSPVTSINASKGQIYPAIKRLKARGLLTGKAVAGDARKSEELSITPEGKLAAREWARAIDSSHVVLDDPLRTRVLSFELLSREEQLEWIAKAKALVKERGALLDEYSRSVSVPHQPIVHRSATELLRTKMEWLDELLYAIALKD